MKKNGRLIAALLCFMLLTTAAGYRPAAKAEEIRAADLMVKTGEIGEDTAENEKVEAALAADEEEEGDETPEYNPDPDGSVLTMSGGVNYYYDQKETYYNLNMDVVVELAHAMGIEGDYWIREDGCKMLGDYIMLAANLDVHPKGSLVPTSLGMGIVVDTGGFAAGNPNQVDIAVNW